MHLLQRAKLYCQSITARCSRQSVRRRPKGVLLALGICVFAFFTGPSASRAQTPIAYSVDASYDAESGVVRGREEIAFEVEEGCSSIRLWLLADRLAVAPSAMDGLSARWVFPRGFERGGVRVLDLEVDGRPAAATVHYHPPGTPFGRDVRGAELVVPVDGRGGTHRVALRFALALPRRFGRLGRADGRVSLTAPWYPLLLGGDGEAFHVAAHRVALTAPSGSSIVGPLGETGSRLAIRGRTTFVPLLLAPEWHRVTLRVRGVRAHLWSSERLPRHPPSDAEYVARIRDLSVVDVPAAVERVLGPALESVREATSLEPPEELHLVMAASRTELAAVAPGLVLLSDRIFEITPIPKVRGYHERALRRAIMHRIVEAPMRSIEPARDRGWATELRAVMLADLDAARQGADVASPRELVGWAGFHPAVDQLLYAPQVAFPDAYFGGGDPPFRDAPHHAFRPTASGGRLAALLVDSLGEERYGRLVELAAQGDVPMREAVERMDGEVAGWIDTWLRSPVHPVDYRLGAHRSRALPDGRFEHRVEILRVGSTRREPVAVEIVDEEGNRERTSWDEEGERGEVVLVTSAPLRTVVVDPDRRRVQSERVAESHPRRNDSNRLEWRPPLAQSFALGANATEGRITGHLDLAFRRRYDLENVWGVFLSTSTRSTGGALRYTRRLGRLRDRNNRIGFVSTSAGVSRIAEGFAAADQGGVRSSLTVGGGYNTKRYFIDPRDGSSLGAFLSGGLTRRDDGSIGLSLSPSLRGNATIPLGIRQVLVLVAGTSWVVGQPLPGERPGVGGARLLRGYQTDEIVADGVVYGIAEYRFTFVGDLDWDFFHLAWVRELQLALFTGVAGAFDSLDGRDRVLAADVGGGLRVHFDYLGIQPGLVAIDVGVPLVRPSADRQRLAPVTVVVGFDQFF